MNGFAKDLKSAVAASALFAVLLGGVYPVAVWLFGRAFFPEKADGSLIRAGGEVVGSSLLAQGFSQESFFHPRPSAAGGGYDAVHSGGSNLGPLSKDFLESVRARVEAYRAENGLSPETLVPADAVTASASGLDPHISVENARLQAGRVARARGWSVAVVMKKVDASIEGRTFGFLGQPRINVLRLNLDLEGKLAP
jgi:potassium-transporting ATPase KdpC subunit